MPFSRHSQASHSPGPRPYRLVLLFGLLGASAVMAVAVSSFHLKEEDARLEVTTGTGTKYFDSEINLQASPFYHLEIPLSALHTLPVPAKPAVQDETDDDENQADDGDTWKPGNDRRPLTVEIDDSDHLVVEANHLYNRRKFFQASEVVEDLLRKNPKHLRGWVMKGSLMYVQGHRDLAKKAWQTALTLDPENREVKSYLERYR